MKELAVPYPKIFLMGFYLNIIIERIYCFYKSLSGKAIQIRLLKGFANKDFWKFKKQFSPQLP